MSVMDSMVVHMRNYINGTPAILDEKDVFYYHRKAGPSFLPPFPVANASSCPGIVTEIPDEIPFDLYIIAVPEIGNFESEYAKDRLEFLSYDFVKYDIRGQILTDANLAEQQELRKYNYLKKVC